MYAADATLTFNAIVTVLNEHGWDPRPVRPVPVADTRERLDAFIAFLNTYDEDGHPHASNEAKRRARILAVLSGEPDTAASTYADRAAAELDEEGA
jgi:hypothetical protein